MTVPRATLRLQFHRDFTFDDALAHVDYFAALGVSHLYASPVTTATPGSTHGYDTVDYSQVSAECGGENALRRLTDKLHELGMGLIVDVVPNHMGVGKHNAWWQDILEWGRHSAFARYFDVDWHSPDPALRGKVLMPVLGASYGDELVAGRIALRFDADSGRFNIVYAEHECPVCPIDYAAILQSADRADLSALADRFASITTQPADHPRAAEGREALREFVRQNGASAIEFVLEAYSPNEPVTRDRLHRLIERQHFRLAWWRTASDEVNWRRFFDISTLAAVRVERPEVFDAVHALIFRLYAEGVIDGVRIDHVDGLAEPREYTQRLRQRLSELREGATPYIVVEKILGRGEALRDDWPVDGTTGYDFMNDTGALLHDPAGAAPLADAWAELSGRPANFADEALPARRKILAENLPAELDRVSRALHRLARDAITTRDFTYTAIRRVTSELAAHFPVYRIYPQNGLRSAADNVYFDVALAAAKQSLSRADHGVLARVDAWLGSGEDENGNGRDARSNGHPVSQNGSGGAFNHTASARRTVQTLFSQLTAPVAAKAIEDTACYRYGRLLSRCEVGADPGEFALTVEQFHAANQERARRFPHAMLATATHDHKRGEDTRARLAVLSEIADEWTATLRAWTTLNTPHRRALDGNANDWAPGPAAEAMLYQTLVGCWPPALSPDDEAGIKALADRVAQWQLKALREAKLRTTWLAPDEAFENGCREFLFDVLAPQRRDGFLGELSAFVARIGRAGVVNSLQLTVLRLASPGVPDLYQGTELWDFSLVDPDNRRPVDFSKRHAMLAEAPPSEYLANWRNGRVKLAIIQRMLALRMQMPELLSNGTYLPLTVQGKHADRVIAFARRQGNCWAVVMVTRLAMALLDADNDVPLIDPIAWDDTAVQMPEELFGRALFDWLSPAAPKVEDTGLLYLREALTTMPVAVLVEDGVPRV